MDELSPRLLARSMLLDDGCRMIVRHLRHASQPFVMLKGATIANWLYENPDERSYTDLDILVPPEDEQRAVALLEQLGYWPLLDRRTLDSLSPEEQPLRNDKGVVVDLHVTLKGAHAPAVAVWDALERTIVNWDWHGTPIPALAPHARAMHLALHVAQGGPADQKAVRDLELALERLDFQTWEAARDLAEEIDALGAFATGLRILAPGAPVADQLRLGHALSLTDAMRIGSAPPSAQLIQRALSAKGWRQRCNVIGMALFPSEEWVRLYLVNDRKAGVSLRVVRMCYPFKLLLRTPKALWVRERLRRQMKNRMRPGPAGHGPSERSHA